MSATPHAPTAIRDAWDGIADGFDRHMTPRTMAIGEQVVHLLPVGPGVRVVDVAAGSGGLSIPAARAGAEVVAVDISPTMAERLRARATTEGLTRLDARVGDGTALDLEDDSFDVAMSLNGVSLFPDLSGGLRELHRVTRPGGEVAVVLFGPLPEVEPIAFFLGALRAVAPDRLPPPTQPLPPFRLAEPGALAEALRGLGLRDVSVTDVVWESQFASGDELYGAMLASNPIAGALSASLTSEQISEVHQVLDGMLRERSADTHPATLRARVLVGRGTV